MSNATGFDRGRLARTLALIVFVTAVFLFLTAERLGETAFQIGAVAIGSIAIVSAITGFLIAFASALDN